MSDLKAINKYYSSTQFEYKLVWNWGLKTTPALHFGYYDEKATNHAQAIVRANEALADYAEIKNDARIVDAGCGLGHSAIWLSKRYNAFVSGITIVSKQVETIKRNLQKEPVGNVEFLLADYMHMPFEDSSRDVVWAFESVCHTKHKADFYKEAYRVLKPGGKLVMAEYLRTSRPMQKEQEDLLHEIFSRWAIPDLDTISEHEAHAKGAGFKLFKQNDVTANVMKSYNNLRENCKRLSWLSKLLLATGIISKVRHHNMLSSLKQADAIEQGVFTYHHIVAEK